MTSACRPLLTLYVSALFVLGFPVAAPAAEATPPPGDVHALIKQLEDPSPQFRADAAKRLGSVDKKDVALVVPALIGLLDDREVAYHSMPFQYTVDGYAVLALKAIGRPAVPGLIKTLKDANPKVRVRVVETLAGIRPPSKESLAAITQSLGDDDSEVRRQAVDALIDFGPVSRSALPQLLDLVHNDPAPVVRTFAVAAVALLDRGGSQAVPALIHTLLQDDDPEVRSQAAIRLGNYGPRARAAVGALIAALADRQWRTHRISADSAGRRTVRGDAAEALGCIGPDAAAALPELRKILREDDDGTTRVTAAEAMLHIVPKDPEPVTALVAMFEEDPLGQNERAAPANLMEAARVLGNLGPAAPAVPALKKALQHEYEFVRAAVAEALAAIARKDAVPLLIERMIKEKEEGDKYRDRDDIHYDDFTVRTAIGEALGELGPDAAAAAPALAAIVADDKDDYFVREASAGALGKLGPAAAQAVPQLLRFLDDYHPDGGHTVIETLGRIGPAARAAVPRLRVMLADEDTSEDIRKDIKRALQQIESGAAPRASSETP